MRGRRSIWAPALGGLLAAALTPADAQAQLFPNLPTRNRQRIDCSQELPVYGLYRNKYYGYYPTCWRQFPPGWGCPSTESPDWDAELAKRPLDIPEEGDLDAGGLGGLGPDPFDSGTGDNLLPDLPGQRSPFELDAPGAGASPFDRPEPGAGASPFDQPSSRPPSPFNVDPFAPSTPEGAQPDGPSTPRSPFDMPGASASPSELPSLDPPVTEAPAGSQGPVAMASDPGSAPELAVIPDARPRPVRLPSGPISGDAVAASIPAEAGAMIPGMAPMPSQTAGMPVGMMPAPSTIGPMETRPGVVIEPGPHGVVVSDPSFDGGESVLMGPSESRPRRRFLSGLFGRGN